MDISNIIYYAREGDRSRTLSLRDLCLREEFDLEDVFHAVRDAVDAEDMLIRLRRISCDEIILDTSSSAYIRFLVTDVLGNQHYLKCKKRKEQ